MGNGEWGFGIWELGIVGRFGTFKLPNFTARQCLIMTKTREGGNYLQISLLTREAGYGIMQKCFRAWCLETLLDSSDSRERNPSVPSMGWQWLA